MTPNEIIGMAWSQQAQESRRESVIRGEDKTLLARTRAEVREGSQYATKDSQLSAIVAAYRTCGPDCYCRDVCDLEGNECNCAFVRGQKREMVGEQREIQEAVHAKSGPTGAHLQNYMLGAITNDPDPHMMQACYATKEAADKLDRRTLQQHRRRADTAESELTYVMAYVPAPRTPSRGKKNAYPLGFYGESSGQRYPPFRSNVTKNAPPPVYGASFYNAQMPVRKLVPRNISRPDTSSSPPAESPPGQVVYPSFPASKSQKYFAHSFPVAAKSNPRVPASDDDDNNDDVAGHTEETHDTICHFSDEPEMYAPNIPNSSATQLARPPTRSNIFTDTTPPTGSLFLPRSRTRTFLGLSKPAQPLLTLPERDFNHPKPAVKQRYVSAGGTTKLDERQEIAGPATA
ncbi:hypothetical protein LTR33_007151 [Friedmanniomyces endolithicus]|nr:hypothetical protein LTR33_007151 [Friedmanniomyces endolithicus]